MKIDEDESDPLKEKIKAMEASWEALRRQIEGAPIPDWHKSLLDSRRKAFESGRANVYVWNEIKEVLGRGPAGKSD